MRLTTLTTRADTCARACAIALGFSLPISVALDNVLLVAILALWIAAAGYAGKLAEITRNQVALAALLLFALLVAGLTYGTRYPGDGLHYLGKYADLAFIPIFVTLFDSGRSQHHAWLAFAAAMALTLVLSCLLWSGLVTHHTPGFGDQANPSVFKHYLTQNLLMAFSALLFAQLARIARAAWQRRGWSALAVLAAVNVTFMSQGRTGQLVLVALILYFAYALWRWRGALAAAAGIAIVAVAMMQGAAGEDNRFARALDESKSWQPGQTTRTSVGLRLEFYRNSLNIVREHPLIGVGTGGFPKAYADVVAGSAVDATTNPHNEYLNIAVQLGIAGLLAMLHMFYRVWRVAPTLPSSYEHMLARGLIITFALGCLFNSLLLDHTEGLLFAWAAGLLFARPPAASGASAQ